MFKSSNSVVCYIAILACAIAVGHIKCEDDETRVVERDSLSLTIPNPFGETPFFETNDQDGRYFGVHIPWIFDTKFHWKEGQGLFGNQLEVNILSGLSHYTYDKARDPQTGELRGPNSYSILGFHLWDNEEQPVQQPPPPPQ